MERDVAIQYRLQDGYEIVGSSKLKKGDKGVDVFLEILRLNPNINRFSFVAYDPLVGSDEEIILDPEIEVWLPRELAAKGILQKLSKAICDASTVTLELNEGEPVEMYEKVLGIGSRVELKDGRIKHIPMMDFASGSNFDEEMAFSAIKDQKGVLLVTDNSFHFWGYNLMDEDQWRNFLKGCLKNTRVWNPIEEEAVEVFDANYIESSLRRGYSVLRIFTYGDYQKNLIPSVVRFT